MDKAIYLNRLLLKYSNNFNIYVPYRIGEKEYPAYGYFNSHNEKYILVQEANMWTMDSYEHMLFVETDEITEDILKEAEGLIAGYMEEQLVRGGEKYPDKNHMSSVLTVVLLADKTPSEEISKQIRKYHFDKGYKFHFRGFSRGRIIAACMEDRTVLASSHARDMKKIFNAVFTDVDDGKPGFTEICAEQGITPFRQEEE